VALRVRVLLEAMSVWKIGSWLLGSSGGRPPLGEAREICAPAAGVAELVVEVRTPLVTN
jgi:hypothetical protein